MKANLIYLKANLNNNTNNNNNNNNNLNLYNNNCLACRFI